MRRAAALAVLVLMLLSTTAHASTQDVVDYKERSLKTGEGFQLQQGYTLELEWIKKDLDAAGITVDDGSGQPLAELIMEKGEARVVEKDGTPVLRVSLSGVVESGDSYAAELTAEQYRDPSKPYPEPVLQESSFRVGSEEARELEEGYAIKASRAGDGAEITLLRKSIPIEKFDLDEGDVLVYRMDVEGQEYTLITARISSIFEDTQGNVNVMFSPINQYSPPDVGGYVEGPATVFTATLATAGVLIILLSLMFRRKS